jgi:3-hydroxybutyryl-CoA dehydrogenase
LLIVNFSLRKSKYIFSQPPIFAKNNQMTIAVLANDDQWEEMNISAIDIDCVRINAFENIHPDVDACLLLIDNIDVDFTITTKPIIVNSVCFTLKEMNATANVARINGWNSFLRRSTWELSGLNNEMLQKVFTALGKRIIMVPDEPGFVTARIIAMVVNEAYFALEDKVSTREEIDIAMKLGTNYPYGPFEWAALIGVKNIFTLLQKLSTNDKRYLPATLLKAEATT